MTDSMSDKHSASFSSTRSMKEIRSSCWMGFLCQCGSGGRVAGEEGDHGRVPKIGFAGADVGAIGAGLTYIGWMISRSSLVLMTQVTDPTVKDWPGLGANGELGKHTIGLVMGSSAHPYLARQLSTKDARQSTEGATLYGRLIEEVRVNRT